MLYIIVVLFAVTAIAGILILNYWLSAKDAPRLIVYLHGLVAAIALVLLLWYAYKNPSHYPMVSITFFLLAAIGGFYMFFRDLRKKNSPLAIAIVHALLAVGGFIALLIFVFA